VAFLEGRSRTCRPAPVRLADQTPAGLASHAGAGWPDFVFAFHEREEIGPARMAKHTGLKPEDF
jgi:hypothetical protein